MAENLTGSSPITNHPNSKDQELRYIQLLEKLAASFGLSGIPRERWTLFENYLRPAHPPLLKFLERHNLKFPTSRGLDGPIHFLCNTDFSLAVSHVHSTQADFGYLVLLIKHATGEVFSTVEHTIHRVAYRYSHGKVVTDVQEMLVRAFYLPGERGVLSRIRHGNSEIVRFLDRGHITHPDRFTTRTYWVQLCGRCH
ncbi:MAG: hypothetical protein K1Y36_22375 [Blastocatellia bacterium]|nr:hypothetical protein [Blastocatellia bacterium]